MYSVVLMMAMAGGSDVPAGLFGGHGCCGGGGHGHSSCYGGSCYGSSCYGGCTGSSCHGSKHGHRSRGGHGCCGGGGHGFFSGGGHGCCGGKHGGHSCHGGYSCTGGCYGSGMGYGCTGGYGASCYGSGMGYGCNGGAGYGAGCYGSGMGYGCNGGAGYGAGCVGGAPAMGAPMMGVPATGTPVTPVTPETIKKPKTGVMAPAPATIIVSLPADARLLVDGSATTSTTAQRVFVSPTLNPGRDYHYTLKAEWVRDGKSVAVSKEVAVRAGEETRVQIAAEQATVASR